MSGIFGSSQWMYASGGFYNGVATQSLRFDDGSSAYLSRTFGSGNQKTWTWSCWVKRSALGSSSKMLLSNYTSGTDVAWIYFNASNQFYFQNYEGGTQLELKTNALYRDVSGWYHVVVALDTTQATASDRAKIYINGEQITSFATSTYPSQNADLKINTNSESHKIGSADSQYYFDGYMSEVNFIDGQQLDPTSFGETKNGVWIPKAYTGSYGTNGFRFEFKNTSVGSGSSSTIGADTSGNDNHFDSSGIVASDCNMPDSPENNFATFNSVDPSNPTFSEGNLKTAFSGAGKGSSRSTIGVASGKWYAEFYPTTVGNGVAVGTLGKDASLTAWKSIIDGSVYVSGGLKNIDGTETSFGASYTDGDIIGVALDMDAGSITVYKNNTSQGEMDTGLSGEHFFSFSDGSGVTAGTAIVNFGQDSSFAGNETAQGNSDANGIGDFYYSPPSGYLALCTANLPEPTISPNEDTQADDYFNTVLNSGDGSAGSFTGVGFQPDFVWAKNRTNAYNHELWDVIRGVNSTLFSNASSAEDTTANRLVSFDSDGFSYGTQSNLYVSSTNSVAWYWKAGGTAVSNTDGSITSSVSANTDAGFSIATWTGNSTSGATIGHGLSSAPEIVITKCRSHAASWVVGIGGLSDFSTNDYLVLNSTNAKASSSTFYQGYGSSTFTVGVSSADEMNKTGRNYITFSFHTVDGYSKFGKHTGNGSTDGTFVYTGFRPAWLMVKNADTAGENWHMFDSERASFNVMKARLVADDNFAENTNDNIIDFTSNGFKWRDSNAGYNGSGDTYIYMCFAENPFKYANAR